MVVAADASLQPGDHLSHWAHLFLSCRPDSYLLPPSSPTHSADKQRGGRWESVDASPSVVSQNEHFKTNQVNFLGPGLRSSVRIHATEPSALSRGTTGCDLGYRQLCL